jgi:predicted Zn-dependent protease
MQDHFFSLARAIETRLRGAEAFTASFRGEQSDFVRFNRSAVRQAGSVVQQTLTLDLIEGRRHALGSVHLTGNPEDHERLASLVEELRAMRPGLPEDPHLLYSTDGPSSERREPGNLPERDAVLSAVVEAGRGRDLVGIHAAGTTSAGFANSFGQRNWHERGSFHLDWSFHLDGERAVKASHAGFEWHPGEFARKAEAAARHLDVLARPLRRLDPGRYRVYLAPAALHEILLLLGWDGFGLGAHRTRATPLLKMVDQGLRLHPGVRIVENARDGVAPGFQENGFLRAAEVVLIEGGAYRDCLVSPRSAAEFGVPTNGASASEMPVALDMAPGTIAPDAVLAALGTGIYVSNLWYLNFSDRAACRITGMTRFATFWVEDGVIREPISAMRFDESVYRILGEKLAGLTRERELLLDPGSYGERSTDSARLPGILVDDFTFTL